MSLNETLLRMRQSIIQAFKKKEYILLPVLKFIVIFLGIRTLMLATTYEGGLSGIITMLVIALIGTLLPPKWINLAMVILVPIFILSANLVLAIVSFVILWIIYLLFMRLYPTEGLLIGITVIACMFHLEILLPFITALFGSFACIIGITIGIMIWYVAPELVGALPNAAAKKDELLESFTTMTSINLGDLLKDETMLATIIVFFIVFTLIYIIRKQSVDYAAYLAIGIGVVMNMAGFGLAILFFDNLSISYLSVVLLSILSAVVATIMEFFSKVLDYQRAEQVTFEDDDNYYYVKVVPRLNTSHKKVKRVYNAKEAVDLQDTMSIFEFDDDGPNFN